MSGTIFFFYCTIKAPRSSIASPFIAATYQNFVELKRFGLMRGALPEDPDKFDGSAEE